MEPQMNLGRRKLFVKTGSAIALAGAGALLANRSAAAQEAELPAPVKELLDPALQFEILDQKPFGSSTYYVISQYEDEHGSGEPVVIRHPEAGEPVIVADYRSLPEILTTSADAATDSIGLSQFTLSPSDLAVVPSDLTTSSVSAGIDAKVFAAARDNINMDSKQAPGTNGGRLACAWAVNRIVKMALGKEIGGGLATANMITVLVARHLKVNEDSITPGTIVISPTEYRNGRANVGHVGIVGESNQIYSNSSPRGRWEQNFSIASWRRYYAGKGLSVQFFRLDGIYF
jgi:hypothetical protein